MTPATVPQPLWRRFIYFALVSATTAGGAVSLADIVSPNGITVLELGILILFTLTFGLIASSCWTALIGFLIQLCARDPVAFAAPIASRRAASIRSRTAIVMPVYHEDPERVCAGLGATYRSLQTTGTLQHFEFFLLSDSTDPAIAAAEKKRWRALCSEVRGHGKIRYRRRQGNAGRKAGNIADFCRRWGSRFEHMVILDADSVMSGNALVKLVKIMQANPQAGIIQTVPLPVKQETLFGRVMQFGSRLCSELLTTGLSFWQLGDGNYFGHNAIIRIKPFMEHCRLPILPGTGPLAGEILSHDFVEAALMRRAGWSVWNIPDGVGSYEEIPTNILDHAKRDRRWCQGNLQHWRLLTARGLHTMSRLHFVMGIMAYVSSPLWLLLLVLGINQLLAPGAVDHGSFGLGQGPPFSVWRLMNTSGAVVLFAVTIGMLLLPKILGAVLVLCQREKRMAFGGGGALLLSAALEIAFTALMAPVMMVFHCLFIIAILRGRSATWNPQCRGSRTLSPWEATVRHKFQLVLGIGVGAVVLTIAPQHIGWLTPMLAGLLLSVPMAIVASRADIGRHLLRRGLFLTPEETRPSGELQMVRTAAEQPSSAPPKPMVAVAE